MNTLDSTSACAARKSWLRECSPCSVARASMRGCERGSSAMDGPTGKARTRNDADPRTAVASRFSSLSHAAAAPSGNGNAPAARNGYDPELLDALRRAGTLEAELAGANETVNALLVRSMQLEAELRREHLQCGRLEAECGRLAIENEHLERSFRQAIDECISLLRADNCRLQESLDAMYASRWWALKRRIGALVTFGRRR